MPRSQPVPERPGFAPSPVKGPVEQVRLSILDAITSGQLRPGDRLPSELEQARGFRVSRTAVREALRSLAQLGLITTLQGRSGGSFVNHPDHEPVKQSLQDGMALLLDLDAISLSEVVEARRAYEGLCARLGAARRRDDELAAMAEAIERSRDAALADDAWLELDIRFHRAMVGSAHNRVLSLPFAALHGVVQPRLNQLIIPLLSRDRVVAQHHAIYVAIKAGDPAAAEDAVGRHVDALERMYRRAGLLRAGSDSTRVAP